MIYPLAMLKPRAEQDSGEAFTFDDDVRTGSQTTKLASGFGLFHRASFDALQQVDGFLAASTQTSNFATTFGSCHEDQFRCDEG